VADRIWLSTMMWSLEFLQFKLILGRQINGTCRN